MSAPVGMHITTTTVTVPANTATTLIAGNSFRKYLAIMNIGTGRANLAFGADQTPVANQGWPLAASATLGDMGGGIFFEANTVTHQRVSAISAAGTTIVVLEGS